ncbi:MAG: hypothetical protein RLZ98_2330 [Pseudomonadota bacterium]|jgi:esterase/lipase superfamily enzyme
MLDFLKDFATDQPILAGIVAAVVLLYLIAGLYYGLTRASRPAEEPVGRPAEPIEASEVETTRSLPTAKREPARQPPMAAPAPSAPEPTRTPARPPLYEAAEKPYVTVTVHYATDRNDNGSDSPPNDRFGDKRALPQPGNSPVTYGTCDVAIPKTHQVGQLEEPGWFESEEPDKHVMILSLDAQDPDTFYTTLADRLSNLRQCFIFVHGFNVSFKNAARRTAQIAYDLRFQGVPLFYSWPTAVVGQSSLSPTAYTEAENNAIWARYHFADFLVDVIRRARPEALHIAAHSMGNRIVTDALIDVAHRLTPEERSVLHEIVLTAPDIDAETFKTHIAPRLAAVVPRISLYASDNDSALGLSESLHHLPRIGSTSAALPMPVPSIEVIDATNANTDYFGHNYYGEAEAIIADIFLATRARRPAAERTATLTAGDTGHWVVRNDATVEDAWVSISRTS